MSYNLMQLSSDTVIRHSHETYVVKLSTSSQPPNRLAPLKAPMLILYAYNVSAVILCCPSSITVDEKARLNWASLRRHLVTLWHRTSIMFAAYLVQTGFGAFQETICRGLILKCYTAYPFALAKNKTNTAVARFSGRCFTQVVLSFCQVAEIPLFSRFVVDCVSATIGSALNHLIISCRRSLSRGSSPRARSGANGQPKPPGSTQMGRRISSLSASSWTPSLSSTSSKRFETTSSMHPLPDLERDASYRTLLGLIEDSIKVGVGV
jgi:hypothetical protein